MKNTAYCDSENKINDDSKLERDTATIANTIPKPKPKPKLKPKLKPKPRLKPKKPKLLTNLAPLRGRNFTAA